MLSVSRNLNSLRSLLIITNLLENFLNFFRTNAFSLLFHYSIEFCEIYGSRVILIKICESMSNLQYILCFKKRSHNFKEMPLELIQSFSPSQSTYDIAVYMLLLSILDNPRMLERLKRLPSHIWSLLETH